jgi:hypothetical protein
MPIPNAMAQDLGQLISNINPYTETTTYPPKGGSTGPMDIYVGPPQTPASTVGQIQLELDNYEGEWNFRGIPQKIKSAVRIKYRYPVFGPPAAGAAAGTTGPLLYWAEESLLVGYAGANGG